MKTKTKTLVTTVLKEFSDAALKLKKKSGGGWGCEGHEDMK